MNSRWFLFFLFLFASTLAPAQSTRESTDTEPSIQSLVEQIRQLQRRVTELEERERMAATTQGGSTNRQTATEGKPAQVSAAPTQSSHDHEASESVVQQQEIHYPNLQIRGFGDVDFSATDQNGSLSGFRMAQFVLHFASPLSAKVNYFGEVSFTAEPTTYALAVERSIIRYDYNDYFKMSFGKYHTPVSYWNTTFHHGSWLQTTIDRPQMIKFGGTDIPVHFLGLQAEGNIPSGGLGLGYNVGVGNGRSFPFSKSGDSGDVNNNRAWLANLFVRPTRFYGLQLGGSFYHDKLTSDAGKNFDEWIASGNAVWNKQRPEIIAEYANVHHRDLLTSQTFNTTNYYVQVAYQLPWQQNKWKPYYRFEYIHRPTMEPVWDITGTASVVDLVGSLVGVRYDITSYAAFKGEYRSFREGAGEPRFNGAFLQTAFTF